MSELLKAIALVDEEYLIGMSNKGIYKRACKDLPNVSIASEISDSSADVKIDDVSCSILLPLVQSKCSCPSASVCKHIIMSILHLKEFCMDDTSEKVQQENKQSEFIYTLKPELLEKLCKAIPTKEYRDFFQQIESGYRPEIEYSSIIKVNFIDKNTTVKLLDSLENSSCTCHSTQLCVHKAEAVICLMLEQKIIKVEDLRITKPEANSANIEEKISAAVKIKTKLIEWMATGLARADSAVGDEAQQLALVAHNAKLAYFEQKMREISSLFDEYSHRRVSFDSQVLLKDMLLVYHDCCTIELTKNSDVIEKISGEFRSEYKALPPLKLAYISTRHFSGRSGYEGDIYYFVDCERSRCYTYNIVRANFYENSGRRRFSQYTYAWDLEIPINQLEGKIIKLSGCKASGDRLSSTSNAHAEIIGECVLSEHLLGDMLYDNFLKLLNDNFNNSDYNTGGIFAAIKPKRCINGEFNSITQRFEMTLLDDHDRKIIISVAHNENDNYVISNLESLSANIDKYKSPPIFFGKVYAGKDSLMLYPIELIGEV